MSAAPTSWLDCLLARVRDWNQEEVQRLRVLQLQARRTGRTVNGFTAEQLGAQADRLEGKAP